MALKQTCIVFALLVAIVSATKRPYSPFLRIREAGLRGKWGPVLRNGLKFCPTAFSKRGFSILCYLPKKNTRATFFINKKYKAVERNAPFYSAMNRGSLVFPLKVSKGALLVKCVGNGGSRITRKIYITCKRKMMDKKMPMEKKDMKVMELKELKPMAMPMVKSADKKMKPMPSPEMKDGMMKEKPLPSPEMKKEMSDRKMMMKEQKPMPSPEMKKKPIYTPPPEMRKVMLMRMNDKMTPSPTPKVMEEKSEKEEKDMEEPKMNDKNPMPTPEMEKEKEEMMKKEEKPMPAPEMKKDEEDDKMKMKEMKPMPSPEMKKKPVYTPPPEMRDVMILRMNDKMTPSPAPKEKMEKKPEPTPEPTPEPVKPKMPEPMPEIKKSKCSIPKGECEAMGGMRRLGMDYVGDMGPDWKEDGKCALTWRKGDKFGGIVQPKVSQLTYEFTPTVTGKFGVVIDMGTKHNTEHNDVWVKCDGGFDLRKGEKTLPRAPDFVKNFHNKNGRSMQSLTVDHKGYNFSTAKWYKGKKYTCVIAARSTQVTVYGIALFPCSGRSCEQNSAAWKDGVAKCSMK